MVSSVFSICSRRPIIFTFGKTYVFLGEALKIHTSGECRDYLVKLGGYVIEERGLVAMKGKGQVRTYWLLSHTSGQMHRRESNNEDTLQVPSFIITNNDQKKRSPMAGVLPRKGSLIGFKSVRNEGSLVNMPAFLRPKGNESMVSIRTNSPKMSKKLRQSKAVLREDINHSNDFLIHSKIPKTSSSNLTKSIDRLNTLNENSFDSTNQSHVKNESLTPLLSDDNHNGIDLTSIQSNCLIDFGSNYVHQEFANREPLSGSKPKLNSQVSVKKWNSCTELDFDKVTNNRITDDKCDKSRNNAINSNINDNQIDETAKDWLKMNIVDDQSVIKKESAKDNDESYHSAKFYPGNCDFVLKSLNECDLKVESSV